jgi:hypothetical protein
MKNAYRIPSGRFPIAEHFVSQLAAANEPITEMMINSMVTAPVDGGILHAGESADIRGLAWDGGYGIARVEVSIDGGEAWHEAETRQGRRPIRVSRLSIRVHAAAAGPLPGDGTGEQLSRPDTGREAHLQSSRLSQQRGPSADRRSSVSGMMIRIFLIGGIVAISSFAVRAEEAVTLKDAPGRDVTEDYCGACHSLEYLQINAGFLNRQAWESEVNKMIKTYGAPIGAADSKTIIRYLAVNYGEGH